ncbi:3-keto-disaccharide hydrolase [Ketogulonicigenium vulgare]|uniref:Cycloisomaltooligosaccharide glucanotransferase n=1 Tax=Ketogulonicigenium vulgare (strain WSH-001) TaxID=759362 RepID=F9Y6B5_KETVW|nr:DUF1080 domain-containing protein [Ketogulonicigenium vulgare]ADO42670.1 large, multifunctional secreted protein [Ketogulonicigenium vulgare Y25]AEM40861.1 Cycloisomaltooligosaccharide glucanotransferase [Ketogulonicigenium vulgare WSH-001]ALJ81023.1 large, multifunctional secreted protein [Ketogulonicigenium vulgare]ANW33782.1 large, multifunctional secreted protein [Ketogulonicigenium vulgare]AOZ54579.1 large, multifunctional secreted protein [Ketogulonicigenium vulgare]
MIKILTYAAAATSAVALLTGGAFAQQPAQSPEASAEALSEVPSRVQAHVSEIWEPVPRTVATPEDAPPSDAIVLFDGTSMDSWIMAAEDGGPANWPVSDGIVSVGSGDIVTADSFCDVQLHIEWRTPAEIEGFDGQDRGNSGIMFHRQYEVQVLDSVDNLTYVNGQAASIYKQHPPLVNASRGPGEWQTYDIVFESPIFAEDGRLRKPAYMTVFHNGVLVQNHAELAGVTEYIGYPTYSPHDCGPILLQDHNADVSYRNIWLRPL